MTIHNETISQQHSPPAAPASSLSTFSSKSEVDVDDDGVQFSLSDDTAAGVDEYTTNDTVSVSTTASTSGNSNGNDRFIVVKKEEDAREPAVVVHDDDDDVDGVAAAAAAVVVDQPSSMANSSSNSYGATTHPTPTPATTTTTSGKVFMTRLNTWRSTSRKVITSRAADVIVAAAPLAVKAGHAVQAAALRRASAKHDIPPTTATTTATTATVKVLPTTPDKTEAAAVDGTLPVAVLSSPPITPSTPTIRRSVKREALSNHHNNSNSTSSVNNSNEGDGGVTRKLFMDSITISSAEATAQQQLQQHLLHLSQSSSSLSSSSSFNSRSHSHDPQQQQQQQANNDHNSNKDITGGASTTTSTDTDTTSNFRGRYAIPTNATNNTTTTTGATTNSNKNNTMQHPQLQKNSRLNSKSNINNNNNDMKEQRLGVAGDVSLGLNTIIHAFSSSNNNNTNNMHDNICGTGIGENNEERTRRQSSSFNNTFSPLPPPSTTTATTSSLKATRAAIAGGGGGGTQSQAALILQSTSTSYMQSVLQSLQQYQYVLLLGQGLMGVNLKNCFNLSPTSTTTTTTSSNNNNKYGGGNGVYVDWITPSGNAAKSNIVKVGDVLIKVGDVDVSKETIDTVPEIIAKSSRPVVIVLTREHYSPMLLSDWNDTEEEEAEKDMGVAKKICVNTKNLVGLQSCQHYQNPMNKAIDAVYTLHYRIREDRQEQTGHIFSVVPPPPLAGKDDNNGNKEHEHVQEQQQQVGKATATTDSVGDADGGSSNVSGGASVVSANSSNSNNHSDAETAPHTTLPHSKQNNHKNSIGTKPTTTSSSCFYATLYREASTPNSQLYSIIRQAFVYCCADSRCLPFIAAHIAREDSYDGGDIGVIGGGGRNMDYYNNNNNTNSNSVTSSKKGQLGGRRNTFTRGDSNSSINSTSSNHSKHVANHHNYYGNNNSNNNQHGSSGATTSSIKLMMWLEIQSYKDVWGVTPHYRRYDHVVRIAQKYIIPSNHFGRGRKSKECLHNENDDLVMFDLRNVISSDIIERVRDSLLPKQQLQHDDNASGHLPAAKSPARDVFAECEEFVETSLCGSHFATFLMSEQCARMRAYLRGSNPFINIWLDEVVGNPIVDCDLGESQAVCCGGGGDAMTNYMHYITMHLLTQGDGQACGFGIIYATFLRNLILPRLKAAANNSQKEEEKGSSKDKDVDTDIIPMLEHLWQTFLAPTSGVLTQLSHSSECEAALRNVGRMVIAERAKFMKSNMDDRHSQLVNSLLKEEVCTALHTLSEELIYDYAMNMHSKFKTSDIHDLACKEMHNHKLRQQKQQQQQKRSKMMKGKGTDNGFSENKFPLGCINRLLRKIELPDSISAHRRPNNVTPQSSPASCTNDGAETKMKANDASDASSFQSNNNAQFAVIFGNGSVNGMGSSHTQHVPSNSVSSSVRRLAATSLLSLSATEVGGEQGGDYDVSSVPSTLESYANVPPSRDRPFGRRTAISHDGWEVSLMNFSLPNATPDQPHGCMYGVSLVLNRNLERFREFQKDRGDDEEEMTESSMSPPKLKNGSLPNMFFHGHNKEDNSTATRTSEGSSQLISMDDEVVIIEEASNVVPSVENLSINENLVDQVNQIFNDAPTPVKKWPRKRWSDCSTIGIALVSSENVIPAMRVSLSLFLQEESKKKRNSTKNVIDDDNTGGNNFIRYGYVADLLHSMSSEQLDGDDEYLVGIQSTLLPYMQQCASPWLSRPSKSQAVAFAIESATFLMQSLQPTPFAVLFITAILEQKIVFSSSRRSMLLYAITTVRRCLHPLEWPHVVVPLVPVGVAGELIHYPAPFMIGIPTDEQAGIDLVNQLPQDITLVDLDAGRVLLAPHYGAKPGTDLRTQVLYLAEEIGARLGKRMYPHAWNCDNPLSLDIMPGAAGGVCAEDGNGDRRFKPREAYDSLNQVCSQFVNELLAGTSSCCLWIEERGHVIGVGEKGDAATSEDCVVLFNEDRFFNLKNLRADGKISSLFEHARRPSVTAKTFDMALSLDDFDLVLETFLRSQAMSTYISSEEKKSMMYL